MEPNKQTKKYRTLCEQTTTKSAQCSFFFFYQSISSFRYFFGLFVCYSLDEDRKFAKKKVHKLYISIQCTIFFCFIFYFVERTSSDRYFISNTMTCNDKSSWKFFFKQKKNQHQQIKSLYQKLEKQFYSIVDTCTRRI